MLVGGEQAIGLGTAWRTLDNCDMDGWTAEHTEESSPVLTVNQKQLKGFDDLADLMPGAKHRCPLTAQKHQQKLTASVACCEQAGHCRACWKAHQHTPSVISHAKNMGFGVRVKASSV